MVTIIIESSSKVKKSHERIGITDAYISEMIKFLFTLFILCLANFSVSSADLYLYNAQENFNDNFSQSIFSGDLEAGEKIHLKDKSVTYKEILGSGNTTLILKVYDNELEKDVALRLPHGNQEKNYTIFDGKKFINYSYNGYRELEEIKLPIPTIHAYQESSYLLVDLIENDFDLKGFLDNHETFTDIQKLQIESSLIDFARQSAIYQSIGDFHVEQLVYSNTKQKWFLLDWSEGHQLARLPSSPTLFTPHFFTNSKRDISEYESNLLNELNEVISEERSKQTGLDNLELERIKLKLSELVDHREILEVYKEINSKHMLSFYTMLQKDFVTNHLAKFPAGKIKEQELELLLNNLGKFSPYYFSQFSEKVVSNIYDLETFMLLYKKMNEIGLDEELEDDISNIISDNMQRLLSNTTESEEVSKNIEKLKGDYGLINYRTKEILEKAIEFLRPASSCQDALSKILSDI